MRMILLDFGEDLDPRNENFKNDSSQLRSGQKLYVAQYLKKLWTGYDQTWWMSWIGDENKLIRFW